MHHLLCALLVGLCAFRLQSGTLELHQQSEQVEIARDGKSLLVYSFATNQFKPYVKELRSLSGENVLLDSPPDHLHHHGLMYAIRVNGVNFWEELPDSGRQKHVQFLTQQANQSTAKLVEVIHWVPPGISAAGDQEPLLVEHRAIDLTINPKEDELALRWISKFTVGRWKVKLQGTVYNGLGLRLAPEWNGVARHQNSENTPYSAAQNSIGANWAAVTHSANQKSITVALFGRPENPGETRFFSMNNPFTYLSATQNLEEHPIEYSPGTEFELQYLLLLSGSKKRQNAIQTRFLEWSQTRR